MKTKDMFFENLKLVKSKPQTILTFVCVNLSISRLFYFYTRSK